MCVDAQVRKRIDIEFCFLAPPPGHKAADVWERLLLAFSHCRSPSQGLSQLKIADALPSMTGACLVSDSLARHSSISNLSVLNLDGDRTLSRQESRLGTPTARVAALATAMSTMHRLSALTRLDFATWHQLRVHTRDTAAIIHSLSGAISHSRHLKKILICFGDEEYMVNPAYRHGTTGGTNMATAAATNLTVTNPSTSIMTTQITQVRAQLLLWIGRKTCTGDISAHLSACSYLLLPCCVMIAA